MTTVQTLWRACQARISDRLSYGRAEPQPYLSDMRWLLLLLILVAAQIALWMSDMDTGAKFRLTMLNALGWGIVFGPILLVNRWLVAVEERNKDAEDSGRREQSKLLE